MLLVTWGFLLVEPKCSRPAHRAWLRATPRSQAHMRGYRRVRPSRSRPGSLAAQPAVRTTSGASHKVLDAPRDGSDRRKNQGR